MKIPKSPLIKPGWLRVFLFCLVYLLMVLSITTVGGIWISRIKKEPFVIGNLTNIKDLLQGEYLWLSVLINLILALLIVFIFRKWIDKKRWSSLGLAPNGHFSDGLSGLFLALALLGTGTLILFITRHLEWIDISFNGTELFIQFGLLAMAAFTEELVFRGYILNTLMESFNKWIALLVSAGLFALSHIQNPAFDLIPFVNIFIAGLLLGLNYIYTKNLWFAILFHLGWNFFQGPILGFRVSGINLPTLLQSELKGDLSITGGNFGFEGSVIGGALTLIALVTVYFLYEKKYRVMIKA
jgi:membrane protease YdiL (CAAX protease family)